MLQSCLSSTEAYPIIANTAGLLMPDSSGALGILSNSRNAVEMVASSKSPGLKDSVFAPRIVGLYGAGGSMLRAMKAAHFVVGTSRIRVRSTRCACR
jgi:hypothetical protein